MAPDFSRADSDAAAPQAYVEALTARDLLDGRREMVLGALLAAAVGVVLLALGPAPGDAAAHLYRTAVVRDGVLLWDNFWYAGHYPLASYSLLYYLFAAVVGNVPLVLGAAVASAAIFTALALHEWGAVAVWPSRVFGVLAGAPAFTGLYSYTVGFATMLAALRLVQTGRPGLALVVAALTLGVSPLAFVFLVLILVAFAIARRVVDLRVILLGTALAGLTVAQVVILRRFPDPGVYPFHAVALVAVLGVSILGVLLARRTPKASAIAAFFALWALGSAVVFVVPSPLGDNWTRLRAFVFPLMLLTAALTRFRPRWLAVAALMGALAYNVVPYLMLIPDRADPRPERASFWTPSVDFLRRHVMPLHRVEVVPTASHWEAYWLPKAGIPIARGWYRQLDIVRNPALYKGRLTPARYEAWLRELSVRYVVLPSTRLDPVGGPAEAAVLRSAGFRVAFKAPDATIYEMSGATPLLTGPAPARITAFGHSTIAGSVGAPGRYLLRERYSPYWDIRGRGCISPTPGGMTWLYLHTSGPFSLTVPHGAAAVAQAIGARRVSC